MKTKHKKDFDYFLITGFIPYCNQLSQRFLKIHLRVCIDALEKIAKKMFDPVAKHIETNLDVICIQMENLKRKNKKQA